MREKDARFSEEYHEEIQKSQSKSKGQGEGFERHERRVSLEKESQKKESRKEKKNTERDEKNRSIKGKRHIIFLGNFEMQRCTFEK